jgi:hypothetical protein
MALKKSVITPQGFSAVDAYYKVGNVTIADKNRIVFNVEAAKSKEEKNIFSVLSFECAYRLEGNNPIAQAYAHLKTLPEFADAIDC